MITAITLFQIFWPKAGLRGFIQRLTSKKFTVELKVYVAHYQL